MKAIITGSEGQDGFYLKEYLSSLGYEIFGIDIGNKVDLSNFESVQSFVSEVQPDEIYHLAAYHHSSEDVPTNDVDVFTKSYRTNVLSTVHLLESIYRINTKIRIFCANSCLIFGHPSETSQNEMTPFSPNCIYGLSKYNIFKLCEHYRNKYNLFAANAILFNHESPRRSSKYVTQKIVQVAVSIVRGELNHLELGDLDAEVDWGFAGDYVIAMHAMLQLDVPHDLVISSGETHSVREFVSLAFGYMGLDPGHYVVENRSLLKRNKRVQLKGDSRLIQELTGWKPKMAFPDLVKLMVEEAQKIANQP